MLFTTAPLHYSADRLFTTFKQQNYIELLHHQMKTPLAVRPVFLKSLRRVEALVSLLQIALQAYQVLERRYRRGGVGDQTAHAELAAQVMNPAGQQTGLDDDNRRGPGRSAGAVRHVSCRTS